MGVVAYAVQKYLPLIISSPKIVTIIAIVCAVLVYILELILLKVFNEDDYRMLPYGERVFNFLHKMKLA